MSGRDGESFFSKWERIIKGDTMTSTPPKDAIRERAEELGKLISITLLFSMVTQKLGDHEHVRRAKPKIVDIIDSALRAVVKERDGEIAGLVEVCEEVRYLVNNSRGVDGWHLNGELLRWDETEWVPRMIALLAKHSKERT